MTKKDASAWMMSGGLVAGLAVYWFINGDAADHTLFRNLLVGVQLLLGVWMMIHGARKRDAT
jgi:hypothetical protein